MATSDLFSVSDRFLKCVFLCASDSFVPPHNRTVVFFVFYCSNDASAYKHKKSNGIQTPPVPSNRKNPGI